MFTTHTLTPRPFYQPTPFLLLFFHNPTLRRNVRVMRALLFPFCLSFARLTYLILMQRGDWSFSRPSLPLPPDSSTAGSHDSNGASLEPRWCYSLLRPLTGHKSPHRAEFVFLSPERTHPSH